MLRIAKTFLNIKATAGAFTISDFTVHFRTRVRKTALYWYKTAKLINGIVLKTQLKTHVPMNTSF